MVKALVIYHSQESGNTELMAKTVAKALEESGIQPTLHNTHQGRFDVAQLALYDCIAVGSPDYLGYIAGGVKQFIDDHYIANVRKHVKGITGKPYSVFYSSASKTSRIPEMLNLFKRLGHQVGEPIACQGEPTRACLDSCTTLGRELAKVCYQGLADKIKTR